MKLFSGSSNIINPFISVKHTTISHFCWGVALYKLPTSNKEIFTTTTATTTIITTTTTTTAAATTTTTTINNNNNNN